MIIRGKGGGGEGGTTHVTHTYMTLTTGDILEFVFITLYKKIIIFTHCMVTPNFGNGGHRTTHLDCLVPASSCRVNQPLGRHHPQSQQHMFQKTSPW